MLTVLNTLLKKAIEWDVIDQMPCKITLLKTTPGSFDFYDFGEYERLVAAARLMDGPTYVTILLARDAGLRGGELRALLWKDIDFEKGQLRVEWSEWQGHYTTTKGNRLRYVPLTKRLVEALRDHRHPGSRFVLTREDAAPHTAVFFGAAVEAGVRCNGTHIMRHTFCSHLAMRGAPLRAIQELAGHKDLSNDNAVHAPEPVGDAQRHRNVGAAGAAWRNSGDGGAGDRKVAEREAKSGEPNFRQLEPLERVAAAA